jgi:ubiquitin-protein ligase E3 C
VQLLISGGQNEIDIDDLRRNTIYHGYRESDPYIQEFWNYLRQCSNEEREKFLVFVTGTNRPPLLGFKYLYPQFCIHQIILDRGESRFPTSSTCMNMFKLPHYGDPDKLKEVLHYAINSNAGFNLE